MYVGTIYVSFRGVDRSKKKNVKLLGLERPLQYTIDVAVLVKLHFDSKHPCPSLRSIGDLDHITSYRNGFSKRYNAMSGT